MDTHRPDPITPEIFGQRLTLALASIGSHLDAWDRDGVFADEGLDALRDTGALSVPLPRGFGGLGFGLEPEGAAGLFETLRRIGGVSISLARVLEGHVNALRLIHRYGTPEQFRQAALDALAGHLFGIWAAESPSTRVRLEDGVLRGQKAFASAAGRVTRPLITVDVPDEGECLLVVPLPLIHGRDGAMFDLHGARSAGTAPVDFDGIVVEADWRIGAAGAYMREPEISLGAWRPLAVQLGAVEAINELLRQALIRRGRTDDALQRARYGSVLVAVGTARLWAERACELAESHESADETTANYIKLARVAIETACLDVIRLTQRSIGLAAFVRPAPVERVIRDLATYLRQPALDMVLDEAAAYYLSRPAA